MLQPQRFFCLLLWLALPCLLSAQTPYWNWTRTGGGTGDDVARTVAIDPNGRAYVAGYFKGQAQFGGRTVVSRSANDMFLACFEADGSLTWIEQAGFAERDDWRVGLTLTPEGGVLLTGSFYGQAQFGTETLTSRGQNDLFIARYSTEGQFEWVKHIGGNIQEWGKGVVAADDGSFYLTGGFYSTVRFDQIALTSAGQNDIFVAAFDRLGKVRWAKRAGGLDFDEGSGITRDPAGNLYVTGWYAALADFGPTQLETQAFFEIFVAKYAPDGRELWVRSTQGTFTNYGRQIQYDSATGDLFLCGSFSGQTDFWGTDLNSQGGQDVFLARMSADGQLRWARSFGGPESDEAYDLSLGSQGRFYVAGSFRAQARFGSAQLTSAGLSDAYVAAANANGDIQWAHAAGGPENDAAWAIASDGLEAQYVAGEVGAGSLWDGRAVPQAGARDAFLAQLGQLRLTVEAGEGGRRCTDAPFTLRGSTSLPQARLEWSPADGLAAPASAETDAAPVQTTLYTLTARFGALMATDTVRVVSAARGLRPPAVFLRTDGNWPGAFIVAGQGGAKPYRYRLDGGPWQSESLFLNLRPRVYVVEVEDANGCAVQRNATMR